MSAGQSIRCRCGARILPGHVLQKGFVTIRHVPVFVYLQYRCGLCRVRGEILLACDETGAVAACLPEWQTALSAAGDGETEGERARIAALYGSIRPEEVQVFAWAIARLTAEDFIRLRRSLTS